MGSGQPNAWGPPDDSTSRWMSVPLPLVMSTLRFVAGDVATLALVSREWHAYARTLASTEKLRAYEIEFTVGSSRRSGLLRVRRELAVRRTFLRELHVHGNCPRGFTAERWRAVLDAAPHLVALSVYTTWQHRRVRWIAPCLEAAARVCPKVQSLALNGMWIPDDTEPPDACEAVLAAIQTP